MKVLERLSEIAEAFWALFTARPVRVESTAIREVAYDRRRRALYVRFSSGTPYEYGSVPPSAFRRLLRAESKGRFISREIRDHYPFRRLA